MMLAVTASASLAPTTAIPESAALPLVGGTLHYFKDPLRYLERASALGDIVKMRFLGKTAWLVSDPLLVDQVLVKSTGVFQKDMFIRSLKRVLGEGLLTSEGDFWKRQRRLIQPAFHRDAIASYAKIMTDHTTRAMDTLRDGQSLDVHHTLM
jgi:cytochrome P450